MAEGDLLGTAEQVEVIEDGGFHLGRSSGNRVEYMYEIFRR